MQTCRLPLQGRHAVDLPRQGRGRTWAVPGGPGRPAEHHRPARTDGLDDGVDPLRADILELPERGYLKPGYFADVVVFDPKTYRAKATFDNPHQYATGVVYLFVNGRTAIEQGRFNGTLAGRVLRHKSPG